MLGLCGALALLPLPFIVDTSTAARHASALFTVGGSDERADAPPREVAMSARPQVRSSVRAQPPATTVAPALLGQGRMKVNRPTTVATRRAVSTTVGTPVTTTTRPSVTTTTAPVRPAVTTTTAAPKAPPATTTTRPPAVVAANSTLTAAGATGTSTATQSGGATWFQAPNGTCAHLTLPMGTMVTVTRISTGETVVCKVNDRGPTVEGMIVDLDKDMFAELAPLDVGVIEVRLEW